MAKKKITDPNAPTVEIVLSTYFPTRIIKEVVIKDLTSDSSFRDTVTLDRKQAKYLYEQLHILYGEQEVAA